MVVADLEQADLAADEINRDGGRAAAATGDISTLAGAGAAAARAVEAFGRLDAMVCCAGVLTFGSILDIDEAAWDATVASHLRGHFACTRAAAARMSRVGGAIVYMSSFAAVNPPFDQPAYAAAKGGVLSLTLAAARDLGRLGITVNCVLPGAATRMTDEIHLRRGDLGDVVGKGLRSGLAAGTWRDPANVAPFVLHLIGDRGRAVSGRTFAVVGYQVTELQPPTFGRGIQSDGPWTQDVLADRFEATFGRDLPPIEGAAWPPTGGG